MVAAAGEHDRLRQSRAGVPRRLGAVVRRPSAGRGCSGVVHRDRRVLELRQQHPVLHVPGVEDPSLAKEWFFRDGKEIGHVPATSTSCSERPDANFTLGPGRSFQLWATFHNVPWHGDGLSLEWSIVNRNALPHPRSAFVDPFPARPTDWGAFEPTTDPAAFGADLTECLAEKMHDPRGFGVGCAKIVVQGAGVALRFLHPRSAE